MSEILAARAWVFRSDNLKSKIQNEKLLELVTFVITFAMTGAVAQAQQAKNEPWIGYLSATSLSAIAGHTEAFRQILRELGLLEGKNIVIEWRSSEGKADRLPGLAAELVRLKVNIMTSRVVRQQPALPRKQLLRFPLSWRSIMILSARVSLRA